jgi:hypothetical protein
MPALGIIMVLVVLPLSAMVEVEKGKIPEKYIKAPAGSKLPNGVVIWDVPQAMPEIKKRANHLWVDTRPYSLYRDGSIKDAVCLVYHKNEGILKKNAGPRLTRQALYNAMRGKDKIVFFCQGPKCHRSYNAAIHAVEDWGLPANRVVWFRDGFPRLYKHIMQSPPLRKRRVRYMQGFILSR